MTPRRRSSVSTIVAAVAVVACGSESTGPTSYAPSTLSQALSELSIPALAVGGLSLAGIDGPAPSLSPLACPYSAADQGFVCAPISSGGITIGQSFTLYGASGLQSSFDPASTSSIHATTLVNGNSVGRGTSLTVSGRQETTLADLVSGPHLLNGWSAIRIDGTVSDETSTYPVSVTVNTSIVDLVLPPNADGAQVWPSSGKITGDINGTIGPTYLSQRTEITFTGTSSAYVGVSGTGGGTKSCKVDLAVAQAVC
jgi:hypothetical protein